MSEQTREQQTDKMHTWVEQSATQRIHTNAMVQAKTENTFTQMLCCKQKQRILLKGAKRSMQQTRREKHGEGDRQTENEGEKEREREKDQSRPYNHRYMTLIGKVPLI